MSAEADDLDLVAGVDDTLLDLAGDDGATTGDREDVFDRHQERLVEVTLRLGDVLVAGIHQLHDLFLPLGVALERLERGDLDDRSVVARELVLVEQLADLELDELEQLFVVDHVGLVERHHDVRHTHLTGEQHVLTRLRHRAVGRRHHQDRAVDLGRTGDHVLDVVGVTGHVDVRVVTLLGLVLDVRDRNGDAALLFLRRLVDVVERRELGKALVGEGPRDRRCQGGLAMVDVTHRADVHVRLGALELFLAHFLLLLRVLWLAVVVDVRCGSGDRDRTDDLPIMSRML